MELEIFVHGALCYSYSGQCLMSSFKGGRSGNRGTCAQPCRQKYRISGIKREDYYLSPCDLSLYEHLREIAEANIRSIKIEGRMRSKEYLAIVVSNYRKALNKLKSGKTSTSEEISLVFNRGFSEGQFSNTSKRSIRAGHVGLKIGRVIKSGKNQLAIRLNDSITTIPERGDGLLIVKNDNDYGFEISQDPLITTFNHFKKGKNKPVKDLTRKDKVLIVKKVWQNRDADFNLNESEAYLTKRNRLAKKVKEIENSGSSYVKSKLILTFSLKNKLPLLKGRLTLANRREITAEVIGNTPFEKPLKKSVSADTIKKQLMKLDKYPFEITQININYDGTLFIQISKINELRRNLLEKLEKQVVKTEKLYYDLASSLSEKRKAVFDELSTALEVHFHDLMLEHARFRIECREKSASSNGIDQIEFMVSMNPGQPFSPLKDSASGGELSRLMLALKTVFHSQNGIRTIIFDEIDTGVSGSIAEKMARIMQKMGEQDRQVISITHLPQIAALGSCHYKVYKQDNDEQTNTHIVELNEEKRVEEIAHMLSGEVLSEAAIENARALIKLKVKSEK
jgi:hypothetical protein